MARHVEATVAEGLAGTSAVVVLATLCGFIALASSAKSLSHLCALVDGALGVLGVALVLCLAYGTVAFCRARKARLNGDKPLKNVGAASGDDDTAAFLGDGGRGGAARRGLCSPSLACCSNWTVAFIGLVAVMTSWVALGMLEHFKVATVPDVDGTMLLAGLKTSVKVHREPNGMAHIHADSREDMFFAQGYVHAQERMWQMEFQRRVGAGRLAEVAGGAAVSVDTQMRTFGFYRAANASYLALSKDTRKVIDEYVAGVNAYLTGDPHLPLEYTLLGFEPEPWTPADSLVWAKLMSFDLSGNMEDELDRYYLKTLGNSWERINELMPPYEADKYPIVILPQDLQGGGRDPPESRKLQSERIAADMQTLMDATTRDWLEQAAGNEQNSQLHSDSGDSRQETGPFKHFAGGMRSRGHHIGASNNWVVGPNLTETGKPFLCNDPHLTLMAPSIWYLNHLESKNDKFSTIGASFVGLPGVVIGHNQHVAWGVTNTGADVQDLYIMDGDDDTYTYKGVKTKYNKRTEVIKVKGKADESIVVRESVYGPVVTDNGVAAPHATAPLSLHWTTLMSEEVPDTTMDAFVNANKATDWATFREALRPYVAPSQNFIFADSTTGDFGYQMPGKIPIRGPGHTGAVPVPGNGDYDWTGFIPYDSLPRTLNPSRGFVATANNRVTPDNYRYNITADWDAGSTGYRAARITDQILNLGPSQGKKLTFEDMKTIQTDYGSYLAHDLVPFALKLPADKLDANGQAAVSMLKNWQAPYEATIGSQETTVFEYWYRELAKLGGKETNATYWENGAFIANALASDTSSRGTDPACTASGTYKSCNEWAAAAMNTAAGAAMHKGTSKVAKWGEAIHQATFKHQVLGNTPLACFADRTVQHGGDRGSVNVGSYSFKDFVQSAGPSYRQVINLADLDGSSFLNPLGQSGNLFSPHYADLVDLWSTGGYMDMRTVGYQIDHQQTLQKPATNQQDSPASRQLRSRG